ncbi:MAG: hypothetical protein HRT72_08445, partial [Flavobacteriales bacterium]|nr:hypothetical protein [Flavobacteriales bacterium]
NDKGIDIDGGASLSTIDGKQISQIVFGADYSYQCNYELWGTKGKITSHRAYSAHPDVSPKITIETKEGVEEINFPPDNHFLNALDDFVDTLKREDFSKDYSDIISQAKLMEEFKIKSN